MSNIKKMKVAIHTVPYITLSGHTCRKHAEYLVVAGANPLGPRGGRCGSIVDGEFVSGRIGKWDAAADFALDYARENGAEYIG